MKTSKMEEIVATTDHTTNSLSTETESATPTQETLNSTTQTLPQTPSVSKFTSHTQKLYVSKIENISCSYTM